MKTIFKTLSAIIIAATITSCKKEETPAPTPVSTAGNIPSLNTFLIQHSVQSQFFTIDNNSSQTLTGSQGTVLTFNANTFVTQSGGPVTGNISIELKEIYSKKDMLFSGVTTNAEHYPSGPQEPLISGGEFYVNAMQGNVQLKLGSGQTYGVFLPSATTPNPAMGLFHGTSTSNGILWDLNVDSSSTLSLSSAPVGYFANCDSIRWGNADCFLNAANYTTFTLNITGTFDPSQIRAYVWYDNSNVVWTCYSPFDVLNNTISDNHTATGVPVHLLVISVKNGNLYTSVLSTTVTTNAVYNMTMTETSETDFTNLMSSLP